MENTVSRTSITNRYGLIAGLILIAIPLLLYILNMYDTQGNWWMLLIYVAVLGVCIHLAMKTVSEEVYQSGMTYGQAVGTGMLTALVAGIISAIFTYVFVAFIAPEILQEAGQVAQEKMEEQGLSRDEIENTMGITKIFISPWFMAVASVIQTLIMGLIVSLIAGFFNQQK